ADGKPVVLSRDILPGRLIAKQPELADEMLKRSIYEVLERDLGVVIHHGVASFRPVRADVTVARRLGVPRGELLLAIWQVDYSDDGVLLLSASANPEQGEPEVVQIAEVEEAARLGADAVVLFTALGGHNEPGMVRILAGVGRACEAQGIPFIAEAEFPTTYASVDELKQ